MPESMTKSMPEAKPEAMYVSFKSLAQQGTAELQAKTLMQINQELTQGSLSPGEASELKTQLDKVNAGESWYRSFNSPIPAAVTDKSKVQIAAINSALLRKPQAPSVTENALHEDVDQLISRALAGNRISSSQAERYYLRLAEVESNLQSAKSNHGLSADQSIAINKTIKQMKDELEHR
jgi:hypothetical protein